MSRDQKVKDHQEVIVNGQRSQDSKSKVTGSKVKGNKGHGCQMVKVTGSEGQRLGGHRVKNCQRSRVRGKRSQSQGQRSQCQKSLGQESKVTGSIITRSWVKGHRPLRSRGQGHWGHRSQVRVQMSPDQGSKATGLGQHSKVIKVKVHMVQRSLGVGSQIKGHQGNGSKVTG